MNHPDSMFGDDVAIGVYLQKAVDDISKLNDDGELRYACGQYERGGENHRLHVQIFLILKVKHRRIWVTNRINGAHCEPRGAHLDDTLRGYCHDPKKAGFVRLAFEHGTWPLESKTGERNDMNSIRDLIYAGEIRSMEEAIAHDANLVCRFPKFVEQLIEAQLLKQANDEWHTERGRSMPYKPMVWQYWLRKYLIEAPREDRRIIFVCDTIGKSGKSRFIEEFTLEFPDLSRDLTAGKEADMACALEVAGMKVLFIDITRSKNEYTGHIYNFAENVKSGKIFKAKFESTMKRFPPPHVVVFTNDAIDLGGRETGKYRKVIDPQTRQWESYEVLSPCPLSHDRYLWWDLRSSHKETWSPEVKWGKKSPPFKSLSKPVPAAVDVEHLVGMGVIVPYTPPDIATSGPEFSSDVAGDGPVYDGRGAVLINLGNQCGAQDYEANKLRASTVVHRSSFVPSAVDPDDYELFLQYCKTGKHPLVKADKKKKL